MVTDELGKQLHDRATRGGVVSAEEQVQLEEWYAEQDRAEMEMLGLPAPANTAGELRAQVDSALTQLAAAAKRVQELAKENNALRREIASLRRQLIPQSSPQSV